MSMNNLTIDGEFRYIINWFMEWSELQRDDFIPIVVDYITDKNADAVPPIVNGGERSLELNEKPMSLFQCRVKLFNQWNCKWPNDFKEKLQQKITEIDDKVGARIKKSLEMKCNGSENLTNGFSVSNEGHDYEGYMEMASNPQYHQHANQQNERKVDQQQVASEVMVVTNAAVTLNDPMQEVLSNETSVDDIEPSDDNNHLGQSKETTQYNNNVAHDDDVVCNDDTSPQTGCTSVRLCDGDYNADDQTRELVEQVVQIRNLQINEDDGANHEDVTTSAASAAQSRTTSASAGPVTVTVNPVVVVTTTTPTLTTNAEVPPVV